MISSTTSPTARTASNFSSPNSNLPPWVVSRISVPELLSTLWIAVLLADVLRGIHETVRPGFVQELAQDGTVYGNTVTNGELAVYGVVLAFLAIVVVLARILPRKWNRGVNYVAAAMMISGVLSSWPKDPDDLVFGSVQLLGSIVVVAICIRWRRD